MDDIIPGSPGKAGSEEKKSSVLSETNSPREAVKQQVQVGNQSEKDTPVSSLKERNNKIHKKAKSRKSNGKSIRKRSPSCSSEDSRGRLIQKKKTRKHSSPSCSDESTGRSKKKKVFTEEEYTRVSCTRIRCAIATFACNEGGFDSAFFAKHFMKNREDTTNKHYNLLANRRHALNIAMNLYKSFTDTDGTIIDVDVQGIEEITSMIQKKPSKDEVLSWIGKHNNLSKAENQQMQNILVELEETTSSNVKYFYGKAQKPTINDKTSDISVEDKPIDFGVDPAGVDPELGYLPTNGQDENDVYTERDPLSVPEQAEKASDFGAGHDEVNQERDPLSASGQVESVNINKYPKRTRRKVSDISPMEMAQMSCTNDDDPPHKFVKKHIDDKIGFGVFAIDEIPAKSYLLTYKGQLVTHEVLEELEERYEHVGAGCYLYFFKHKKHFLCIDATHSESLCKFVNDSSNCFSNCRMEMVVNDDTPYLCLFALRDIAAGEELRYNYGDSKKNMWWRNDKMYNKPFKLSELNEGTALAQSAASARTPSNVNSCKATVQHNDVRTEIISHESSSDEEWRPQSKQRKTPRRKRKRKGIFTDAQLLLIRNKCRSMIKGRKANQENIEEALEGTSLIRPEAFNWKQIQARIG